MLEAESVGDKELEVVWEVEEARRKGKKCDINSVDQRSSEEYISEDHLAAR